MVTYCTSSTLRNRMSWSSEILSRTFFIRYVEKPTAPFLVVRVKLSPSSGATKETGFPVFFTLAMMVFMVEISTSVGGLRAPRVAVGISSTKLMSTMVFISLYVVRQCASHDERKREGKDLNFPHSLFFK